MRPDDAAKTLEGLGSARDTLSTSGALPTLARLATAMAVVGFVAEGIPFAPLTRQADPYSDVRAAWLTALPRYQRLLARDAAVPREPRGRARQRS